MINWENSKEWNQKIADEFTQKTNSIPELKQLRDYVEAHAFGFGERAFYWMWKLIVDEMPQSFTFLEIGVFRGQTLALIKLLAKLSGKKVKVYGITPLDSTDGHWESNYKQDIIDLHKLFKLPLPNIIKGLSTDEKIIEQVCDKKFDLVYIDGGHSFDVAYSDLLNYGKIADKYLVIDDCANDLDMPFGFFQGIQSVTDAVNKYIPNTDLKFQFNVIHNKVFKV
jgi:hypothetical protein